ncbi:MAG: hypothetical protein CMK09_11705 [Ponticaulis sp.]|nr:hypothetical protein [Ponticaulis sp.]|tara:strand:+ start:10351 stop:10986 length:636 start_codon:yes stop_codon:yes gene_type:complete
MFKLASLTAAACLFAGAASAFPHCVEYSQTGGMSGTVTECFKTFWTSYSSENLKMKMMGFSQEHNQNTIRKDGKIYSWDPTTKRGTVTNDPWAGTDFKGDPVTQNEAFLNAMGFSATGETRTIAGLSCAVRTSSQMGTVCITDDLILLSQSMSMGPMSFERVATKVTRGTSGDSARYSVPTDVVISDVKLPTSPGGGIDIGALINGGLNGN